MQNKNTIKNQLTIVNAVLLILVLFLLFGLCGQRVELAQQREQIENLAAKITTYEPLPDRFRRVVDIAQSGVVGISVYIEVPSTSSEKSFSDRNMSESTADVLAGQASGVIVGKELVLTCWHVVSGMKKITITPFATDQNEVSQALEAHVLAVDEIKDLVLLTVPKLQNAAITRGNSEQLHAGDLVICIANPASDKLAASVSSGVVSGINRTMQSTNVADAYVRMFQTDAAINGGSSGGGIFDIDGQLIGIVARKYVGGVGSDVQLEGIGMCIPVNEAEEFLMEYLEID